MERKNYVLLVLLVILAFNCADRVALGLMSQDIKRDLALTDTQLGFLTGMAFALFYSIMGIPLARWADRGNRITITALTTGLWSVAVAVCGIAGSFVHLLLIRVCVAVGEAGCMPTANSLIADYFSRGERPRAVARYLLGGPLSLILGYFLAGWLDECYGWRKTFVILGFPGLGLAILARLTLLEPVRAGGAAADDPKSVSEGRGGRRYPAVPPTVREVVVALFNNLTFRHLLLSYSVVAFFGYGITQWQPAFFIRSFGFDTASLGTWLALIYGIAGVLGVYWGGELAFRYAANNERVQLRVMAALYVGSAGMWMLVYVSSNQYCALGLTALAVLTGALYGGPLFALIQTLVPESMRAQSVALIFLVANFIGMGLGPLAVGMLSVLLHPWAGKDALRYALLTLCPGYLLAAWHAWRAGATVQRDLQVERESASDGERMRSTHGHAGTV